MVEPAFLAKWQNVVVDGEKNRSHYVIEGLLKSHLSAGTLRHYVVIGVANNAAIPDETIDKWIDIIGSDRALVLITGHGSARTTWIPESNDAIQKAVQRYPNQVVVADWFAVAQQHPDGLYRDQTHPNEDGNLLFVSEVERALLQAQKLTVSMEN